MSNKYQEALDNVKIAPSFMGGNTKYSTNLNSATPFSEDISILQELVNKATPKKPIKIKAKDDPNKPKKFSLVDLMGHTYYCPDCNRYLGAFLDRHCKYCGQALDGSDK